MVDFAIQCVQFSNVHLRMDGTGVTAFQPSGGGFVNCQFGIGPWETVRLEQQPDGTVAIASVQFPNVYLRVDGAGVTAHTGSGGVIVNCQFGIGPNEKFLFQPQPDGTVAFASAQFPNVYLRMDGTGVTAFQPS